MEIIRHTESDDPLGTKLMYMCKMLEIYHWSLLLKKKNIIMDFKMFQLTFKFIVQLLAFQLLCIFHQEK